MAALALQPELHELGGPGACTAWLCRLRDGRGEVPAEGAGLGKGMCGEITLNMTKRLALSASHTSELDRKSA